MNIENKHRWFHPVFTALALYFVALVLLSGCGGSSAGNMQDLEDSTVVGGSGNITPTENVYHTPTPKTAPFFVGPRYSESSYEDEELVQSLPGEVLSELPKSTGEAHPTNSVGPEEDSAQEQDPSVTIDSNREPPKTPVPVENNIFGYEYGEITEEHGVDLMNDAGAQWVRRAGIWWPDLEPTKGSYDWSKLESFEEEFLRAYQHGMQVILIVRGAPEWAQADPPYNRTCGRIREEEFSSFGKFLKELVKRYSKPPYNVKYWEIWNEPDVEPSLIPAGNEWMGCWGDASDPYYGGGYYADLLKVVYPEIKSANSKAQVLVGGLLMDCDPDNIPEHKSDCRPSKFLEGILESGGGNFFDGISFHAYDADHSWLGGYYNSNWHSEADTTGPVLLAKVAYLKNLLDTYDIHGKELVNTEAALLCIYSEKSVCEMTKAYYVVHSYVSAYSVGLDANLWYFWQDRRAGLFENDLKTLPAYETYSYAQDQLVYATYNQEITDFMPSVRVYEFLRGDGRLWVLWSMDGKRHHIALPSIPNSVNDAFGRPLTPRKSLEVDLQPLYVVWDN